MGQSTEAARLFTTIGADLTGLKVGAREAEGLSRGVAGNMAKYAAMGAAAFGAMKIGKAIGKEVVDVDMGLRKTNSLFGLTGRQGEKSFRQLGVGVKALSNQMGVAQSTLSEGLYQAISAGVPRNNVFDFMRIATKASIAGVTDSETAVDGLSTAMNAFKSQSLGAKQAADMMFMAVNIGKTEFPDLAHNIGKAAPMIAAAKVKFSDFMAAVATLTSKGINTEESMTDLKAAMQSVLKPTADMTKAYKQLGVSGWDELLKRKGSMQAAFNAIAGAAGGNQEKLISMMGTMEGTNAVLSLTGVNAKDASKALAGIKGSAGAADKAYAELNKSVSRQWDQLKTRMMNFGVAVASQFLPQVLGALSTFAAKAETAFNDPAVQQGIVQFGTDVKTLGSAIGTSVGFVVAHGAAFKALAVGMIAARTATITLGAAQAAYLAFSGSLITGIASVRDAFLALEIAMVSNPIGALAVGIGIAAAAFMALRSSTQSEADALRAAKTQADALQTSLDALAGTNMSAKEAQLQVSVAAQQLTAAHRAAVAAVKQYGQGSEQAKAAMLAQKQAALALERAQLSAKQATQANNAALTHARTEYTDTAAALHKLAVKHEAAKTAALAAAAVFGKSSAQYQTAHDKVKALEEQMAPLAAKMDTTAASVRGLGEAAQGSGPFLADLRETISGLKSKKVNINVAVTGTGSFAAATGGRDGNPLTPYAHGGRVSQASYIAGEDGAEQIVPLSGKYRNEGIKNWREAGIALGMPMYAKGGLHGKRKKAPPKAKHTNVGSSVEDIAAARARADATKAGLTARQNADNQKLTNAINAQQFALEHLPGAKTAMDRAAHNVTALHSKYDKAPSGKGKTALGIKLRDAKRAASDKAKAYNKMLRDRDTAKSTREQLADDIVSLQGQMDSLDEQVPDAFGKLKSGFEEQRAAADLELARAELTDDGGADDKLAKGKIRDIAAASAAAYQNFLNTTPMSTDARASVEHDIAAAVRDQKDADSATSSDPNASAYADGYRQQAEDRARIAEGNLALANTAVKAFASNDIGYGGGTNGYQAADGAQPTTVYNIQALSGYDPAIQAAMAAASNGGNATGGNADRLYTGRSTVA